MTLSFPPEVSCKADKTVTSHQADFVWGAHDLQNELALKDDYLHAVFLKLKVASHACHQLRVLAGKAGTQADQYSSSITTTSFLRKMDR